METSSCRVCIIESDKSYSCNHDKNTIFLMAVWLKHHPKSLFEFHICVHHEHALLDTNRNIYQSIKKFVDYYNLYE